ncbi:MAG: thiosulfate sulfurtransferase [Marinilabiliales bacterium]|nr:MAG: thiosulfate sulfurtransferase [Marinilabiliales bacterium]
MNHHFKEISTNELHFLLNNENARIIDVRSVNAYNGWKLKNEKRGGHIQGAKSLPIKWSNYIDWIEIVRSKHIVPENALVIYSYEKEDSEKVARLFQKAGYDDVRIYNHFINEWSANEEFPMDHLTRYRDLVSADWVNELINGKNPPEYNNDKFIVVHAHYRNRDAYLSGHIPGAIDMDTLALEAPETWNRRSPEELKKAFEEHGISSDTTVVLYGKFMSPDNEDEFPGSAAGHIGAIRNAMIMIYAGVKDVRVLNGGFQSWKDAGFEISTVDETKKPVIDFGVKIPANPDIIVDVPKAKEMIESNDANLVCVRSWPEYIGEVSGYNYIEKTGRIPGAIFGNCGTDAYHMENYRNLDHTTRQFNEIAEIWEEIGITPDKHNAFYCGTGWRGSEAFYNAWLMGWSRVSVFDGGWYEWSNDPDNPIEKGTPKSVEHISS